MNWTSPLNGVSATYDALGRMVEAGSQEAIYRLSEDKLTLLSGSTLDTGIVPCREERLEIHRQR